MTLVFTMGRMINLALMHNLTIVLAKTAVRFIIMEEVSCKSNYRGRINDVRAAV